MGLAKYHKKRDFSATPEPKGEVHTDSGPLRFVIQKHAASHLHYDFRLELDGVLKSWAVPKGPSLKHGEKRLAMAVEDHPYDYRTFEGIIPEGNYGAGNVIIWDEGTYYVAPNMDKKDTEATLRQGLEKGKIVFTLQGTKLHGEFALVKMHGREENSWLLLKHDDEYASDTRDITQEDRSAVTGRTLDDIAHHVPSKSVKKEKIKKPELDKSLKSKMPHHMKPMLATLVDEPFDKAGWLYEIKWDGYRAVSEINDGKIAFYSRNFKDYDTKFPLVYKELQTLKGAMILDGEVVALDKNGSANFGSLQDYEQNQDKIVYYVFDLLYYDGYNLEDLPLIDRKALLKQVLPAGLSRIRYCEHIEERGTEFFNLACEQDLEGIIAKDAKSVYLPGKRSPAWLKIKSHQRQEAIICGYTEPRGSRKDIGALILGVYKNNQLTYIGHTGTGMSPEILRSLEKRFKPLILSKSPFETKPKTNSPATWVEPKLVCEIKFQEWTDDGHMRQPVFMGLREDKPAKQVVMEEKHEVAEVMIHVAETEAKPLSEKPSKKQKAAKKENFADKVALSHLDKVYWPKMKYTKGMLIEYYQAVAPIILPYLKDRPLSLRRYPNGVEGQAFFQKDNPQNLPDYVATADIYSESNEKNIHFILCQNEETLLYLANLGCIDMNPWNSRVDTLENPDYMVIDLDPSDGSTFDEVITAARVVKDVLESIDVKGYCKTSGASGLHVYVPLNAQYDYEICKEFGHLVAALVVKELPQITTLERSLTKRNKQHIYVDYLQNRHGQTLASAFSVRATEAASVSTPLHWDEVKSGLTPQQFTIKNSLPQVNDRNALWQPTLGKGFDLQKCFAKLNKMT